ncbi:helix-turn-helix domain-containing protein [Pseudobutyrivibrio xylanivorans]|uniref:Helix-turn-helix domain-containing protein n=1 Tax=Pseudobutyrivibrio xylanivorans TaxID=185007 RepID=A0A5P6VQN2_PSEXY|nr:helix-turn-helix domain-containing protein [Pseudobutyrivibrio xylanivorans]QFJ54983.1 helix-turn-helix domain-containing protein [Pseudobutyrivibrio xylanivorans]
MSNERNAGRKPKISDEQFDAIISRHELGESIASLAAEYGVSRQALHKRIKESNQQPLKIDWCVNDENVSSITVDLQHRAVVLANYAVQISKLPFGFNMNPTWQDMIKMLEEKYLIQVGVDEPGVYLFTDGEKTFNPSVIPELQIKSNDELPEFAFTKKDILLTRTDTDGFQMKALTYGRSLFVKSQAIMASIAMRDWAVEIIASDIANQLGIPCVQQKHCIFAYGGRKFDAVYSSNFELDGYTFLSFESLLEEKHISTKDDFFLKMNSIEKLKWCAKQLSEMGNIPYEESEKYMLNLSVLDCLVGNVDRHTRNFGLFFNSINGEYQIPLIFDNGMGLFEHDYYRDNYHTFEEAMNNVYVSPYGEDPFDFLEILNREYKVKEIYKGVNEIKYIDILNTPFAKEYERRMSELWQKLD